MDILKGVVDGERRMVMATGSGGGQYKGPWSLIGPMARAFSDQLGYGHGSRVCIFTDYECGLTLL